MSTLFGKPSGSVVKHPGALTEAARRNGRSKLEEAEVESHSSDPSICSRGELALRFMGAAKHGNIHHGSPLRKQARKRKEEEEKPEEQPVVSPMKYRKGR
jgi:hypothetical protein